MPACIRARLSLQIKTITTFANAPVAAIWVTPLTSVVSAVLAQPNLTGAWGARAITWPPWPCRRTRWRFVYNNKQLTRQLTSMTLRLRITWPKGEMGAMSVIPPPLLHVAPPLGVVGGLIGGLRCFTVGNNSSSNNTKINNADLSSKVILAVKVLKAAF